MANSTSPQMLKDLYDTAFEYIKDAKKYKQSNQLNLAHDLYITAIGTWMQIIKIEPDINKRTMVKKYLKEFISDAEQLQTQIKTNMLPSAPAFDELNSFNLPDPPSASIDLPDPPGTNTNNSNNNNNNNNSSTDIFEDAQEQLDGAIQFDQNHQFKEALDKYKFASELFLEGMKQLLNRKEKIKYRDKVNTIVGRCEILHSLILKKKEEAAKKKNINSGVANEPLTDKEIRVLRASSFIRNLELVPWMDMDDNMRINDCDSFKDSDGLLPLSNKQKNKFGKWKRIKNICKGKPQVVSLVTPYSITQTLISDCSFVSSMVVTALYEKIFRKQLITSIIFPQKNGIPIYNPCGKYAIKLYINGCDRKVVIDDYLPVSNSGRLLCSYSNNVNEFWVSLIEKAFLKVMGGYDFPGSTSAEDLHVLTGWIPERIGFKDGSNGNGIDTEKIFSRLVSGYSLGDCLITLSSNKMSEEDADRMGLVPTHAYAVLRVEKLGSHKFMLIKNPWAEKRWKGRFSAQDNKNWTPQLRKALNYNPNKEKQFDNGIFWMCLEDVMEYFSAVFLNWNPELFKYKITQHGYWSKKIGPKNDSYNLGYNPQFTLDCEYQKDEEIKEETKEEDDATDNVNGSVWILLTKHMESSKRQEQDKNDFLTLHVYDESTVNTRDRRVFHRKGALHTGTYINSPHYLMRIDVTGNGNGKQNKKDKKDIRRYTIIISQYEKKHDVAFTIRAYSTLPARFKPIDDVKLWRYQKVFNGFWTKKYCGGSPNHDTFPLNPQFKITTFFKTHLRFFLEAPIEFSINIQLYLCINNDENDDEEEQKEGAVSNYDDENVDLDNDIDDGNDENGNEKKKGGKIYTRKDYSKDLLIGDSGPYRYGVTYLDVMNVEQGTYIAIISTFKPSQCGGFKFTIKSVENLSLKVV